MNLRVENGSFAYTGEKDVLREIGFEVGSGEILAILGPNGSGKTTLLRCVMGMLRWKSGRSLLDGADIHSLSPRTLWSRMAYVPQARNTSGAATAFETVLLGRSARLNLFAAPGEKDAQKAQEVMESLGIWHLRNKKCAALSGGELQMVLIARALAAEPGVLILDEPESNLDFRNQLIVLDAMTALKKKGMTCVFNTHYPAHALQRADRALLLTGDGNSVFGPIRTVVTQENIRRAFGVNAVITNIDTPEGTVTDIIPLSLQQN